MFTSLLHRENTFNQIIHTSILSSTAFRPLAEQCDSVQKTFLISRYILQKMVYKKWLWKNANFFLKYSEILFFLPGDDVWCPAYKNSNTAEAEFLLAKQQKQNSILQITKFPDVAMKTFRHKKNNFHFMARK